MKNNSRNYITFFIGLFLLALGVFLVKTTVHTQGVLHAWPYVCIGIGCGLFGYGMGNIVSEYALRGSFDLKKQLDIEKNDERNIMIANKAKGRAFDIMTFVFSALMISFALMGVEMVAVVLLVFAYLFVHACAVYYRCRYDHEM